MFKKERGSTSGKNTPNDFYKWIEKINHCWNWIGFKDRDGYGIFGCNGKKHRAHRWIYQQNNSLPKGKLVCHTCDNPSCVNPKHLYAGSHRDNVNDAYRRKRKIPPYYLHNAKRDEKGRFTSK
jgi:hypothetical protein